MATKTHRGNALVRHPQKRKAGLTPAQKSAAKARADAAGRRYPNRVDNMWAARQPRAIASNESNDESE